MRAALASAPPVAQAPVSRGKRIITPIDDALEREADRMADKVVAGRIPEQGLKPANGSQAPIPPSACQALASPGEPLGRAERGYFEPRFGKDLSGISIHRDAAAEHSATALDARAYTYGNHIVFGAGQFVPGTPSGNRLIAHELAHTMQQQGRMPAIQRKPQRDTQGKDRPAIVSVTAYQGAKTGDAVLSDGTSATVEIIENKLAPGDYKTTPVGHVHNATAQGMPGKFVYRYPVDPYTQELLDGVAPHIEVHIHPSPAAQIRQLPNEIRDFVTSDRARAGSSEEYQDAAFAGQILKEAGVTADELILVQESLRHDREIGIISTDSAATQSEWALEYVEKRKNKKLNEASNWDALVEMAKILADAPTHLLHHGGVGSILNSDNNRLDRVNYMNLLKFNKIVPRSDQELRSTGARLLSEFQALIRHFENALVADLTNLAVAALDEAEATILRMDKKYVGMWQDKKWSPHYFWNEVERINSNEKVIAAAAERDKVKSALDREQREDDQRMSRPSLGFLLAPAPDFTSYSQRTEAREKQKESQDQLFNQVVAAQSGLKVAPGFSAEHILAAKGPDEAVSRLTAFLFYGRRRIATARDEIRDRTVIFAADKIIDAEKERLKGPLGAKSSEISRVIDDLARYRKSQTSIWKDILKVLQFVAMFIPGPIGWGVRLGLTAVTYDQRAEDITTRRALHSGKLSAKSVGSGEEASALFEAAFQVATDLPVTRAVSAGKRFTVGAEHTATHSADDAASIASRTASTAEHGAPKGLADDVAGGGAKTPDPPSGTGLQGEAPKPDLGVPTFGPLSSRTPKGGERVEIVEINGQYYEYEAGGLWPATGQYSFVQQDGRLWGSRYGHAEAAMGGRVEFAGQVEFNSGTLIRRSNESGTYKPANAYAHQADLPVPSQAVPPHEGKKVQLPVFQERTKPRTSPTIPDEPAPRMEDLSSAVQQRREAAKAKYGEPNAVMMATPGSPDRRLINELAARGEISMGEMQNFVEAVMREKPILNQLSNARRLTGEAQRTEILEILHRAFREDRLRYEVVPDGVVRRASKDPRNFASIRAFPGGKTLKIEESAFNSTERLVREVSHELAYFYGNVKGEFPFVGDFNGLDCLDLTIQNGGRFPF